MIKGVYHILRNSTPVTDVVSQKIFPVVIPQGTKYPCLVINTDSTQVNMHKQSPTGLVEVALQVEIYADNYADVEAIKNACRSALDNYKGTASGETFQRIMFEDEGSEPLLEPEIFIFTQRYTVRELI